MHKQITVPGLGLVQISKKSNAKRLKIRIHPEKGILVTIPLHTTYRRGKLFVLENIEWIKSKSKIIDNSAKDVLFDSESVFITRFSETKFEVDTRFDLKGKIRNNQILFLYNPLIIDFEQAIIQEFIKKTILKSLKKEASVYLVNRFEKLSKTHKLTANKVSIGSASTRWGTCNSRDEIRLSCRLMLLPDHIIDYVIIHELCHIIHKNHSKKFHDLLNIHTSGKSSMLNKELKSHSIHIKPGDYRFL